MNIALLEGSKHWTGGSKRAFLLARELRRNGHKVIIVCPPKALLGEKAAAEGIKVERIMPMGSIGLFTLNRLFNIFRKQWINVVDIHSSAFYRTGGVAGKLAGAKVVFTRNVAFRKSRIKKLVNRLMYALSDKIIAVSDQVKSDLVGDFALEDSKVEVIVDGIDPNEFVISKSDTQKIREEFKLEGYKSVGIVTRMDKTKGHKLLLESLQYISAKMKDIKFVITGTGKIEGEILHYAKSLKLEDKVVFTGFRNDIPQILSAVDVTVMPSFNEGLGMCILESLASGKPVVAFKIGGIPEVVIDGFSGILVDPVTAPALANGIVRIFNSDYKRMGARGKDLIMKKFSLYEMAQKTYKIYEGLLKKPADAQIGKNSNSKK